jgi:hypothetical protein
MRTTRTAAVVMVVDEPAAAADGAATARVETATSAAIPRARRPAVNPKVLLSARARRSSRRGR